MSDILSIGSSGINAYRQLLEVTGNNIVNANTTGYVRRDVELSVLGAGGGTTTSQNSTGNGVIVDMVTRASDPILQSQTLNATSQSQMQQTLSQGLTQLETSIANPSTNINTSATAFFNSLQDLASSPTSIPARQTVISTGQQLASEFNAQANYLSTEINTGFSAITAGLGEVNSLTTQLAKINLNISQSSSSNQQPNDLLDQRDQLLNKLSKLVGINVTTTQNGVAQIHLGSNSGPLLVDGSTSKNLNAINQNNQVSILYDPSGFNMPTNEVTSGSIAGLLSYNNQALTTLQSFDDMASAFANQMNTQNQNGVDLNGNAGQIMFSTAALMATPSPANQGNATLTITSSAPVDPTKSYTAQFDGKTNQWTVTSNTTKEYVTGTNNLSLDGQTFTFGGTPAHGDYFSIAQNPSAASNIKFMLNDPATIAASASHFADALIGNTGSATLTINNVNQTIPPAPQPLIQNIFSQSQAAKDALGVKQNGLVASIPAGTQNISLSSLQGISAATFAISDKDLQPTINLSSGSYQTTSLALKVNGAQLNPPLTITLSGQPNLTNLAASINNAISASTLNGTLYASINDGSLSINALGSNVINTATLSIGTSTSSTPSASWAAHISAPTTAGNLEVFTREGVQLSGPLLSLDQQQKLLTTANGFLPTAVYKAPNSLSFGLPQSNLPTSIPTQCVLNYSINGVQNNKTITISTTDVNAIAAQMNTAISGDPNLNNNVLAQVENGLLVINGASNVNFSSAYFASNVISASKTTAGTANGTAESQTLTLPSEPTSGSYSLTIPLAGGGTDTKIINLAHGTSVDLANAIQQTCGSADGISCQAAASGSGVIINYNMAGIINGTCTLSPAATIDESNTYRNTQVTSLSSPLNVINTGNTAHINITSSAGTDSAYGTGNSAQAGGAYNLNINGLPPLTFAGDQIAGLTTAQLTSRIASTLNNLGTTTSVTSAALALNGLTSPAQLNFTVSVNGVDHNVLFKQNPTPTLTLALNPQASTNSSGLISIASTHNNNVILNPVADPSAPLLSGVSSQTINFCDANGNPLVQQNGQPFSLTLNATTSLNDLNSQINNLSGFSSQIIQSATNPPQYSLHIQNNNLNNDGSLSVSGSPDLSASVTRGSDGLPHLTFTLAPSLSQPHINFSSDPTTLTAMGLAETMPTYALKGSGIAQLPAQGALPLSQSFSVSESSSGTTSTRLINVSISSDGSVSIQSNNQTDPTIQGHIDSSGRLILSDSAGQFSITPQSLAERNSAAALGFIGTDLTLTQNTNGLNISSNLTQTALASTAGTISRIAQNITINAAPEDLLVTMTGLNTMQSGQVISQFTLPAQPAAQTIPNVTLKIIQPASGTSAGNIEIIDNASHSLLATRSYLMNQPITYMDASFAITGDAQQGDQFTLVKDTTRSGDNTNGLLLAAIQKKNLYSAGSGTFSDVYNTTISNLGAASQSASTASTTAANLLSGLQSSYDALTGVNMDTEAANLMRYQQDYTASAQVIQTAKTIFDAIKNIS
jgi:flagellar hook-associated protein 1